MARLGNVLDNEEVRDPLPSSGEDAATLRRHDFRKPPGDSATAASPAPSLDALHAAFARGLATSLTQHLRSAVEISPFRTERIAYQDFVLSLEPASCLAVIRVDPPGAHACFDLPLSVIYPMIDRLLGGGAGSGASLPVRAMTQIEQGLALQIVERAAGRLADSWSVAVDVAVTEESLESNPAALRLMPAGEMVSVTRFAVSLSDGGGGTMSLCLPGPVVCYLVDGTGTYDPSLPSRSPRDPRRRDMSRNILDAALELRALLAETKLRLSDVLMMQAGDVITTDHPAGGDAQLHLNGAQDIAGQLVQLHGRRSIQVTRVPGACGDAGEPTP